MSSQIFDKFSEEEKQFIQEALRVIPHLPSDRLPAKARALIESDKVIIDGHMHLFDTNCLDIRYMISRMIGGDDSNKLLNRANQRILERLKEIQEENVEDKKNAEILREAITTSTDNKLVERIFQLLFDPETSHLKKWVKILLSRLIPDSTMFFKIFEADTMREVYDAYMESYAITGLSRFKNRQVLPVALGMDINQGWLNDNTKKSYSEQLEELAQLSLEVPIIPFLPVHPERTVKNFKDERFAANTPNYKYNELYDSFLHYFRKNNERGQTFAGVKIYPSLGYLPTFEQLRPIYYICEKLNIPIISHVGGSSVRRFQCCVENNLDPDEKICLQTDVDLANHLNHPSHWVEVLKDFPKLKVNLAHFGGTKIWLESPKIEDSCILETILKLVSGTPGLYADISFNQVSYKAITKIAKSADEHIALKKKMFYGTDFWVDTLTPHRLAKIRRITSTRMHKHLANTFKPYKNQFFRDNARAFLLEKVYDGEV